MRTNDRSWMLPLLELLYADYSDVAVARLFRDPAARAALAPLLGADLEHRGYPGIDLASDEGDNLLLALLAHRARLPLAEARDKVSRNVALARRER